MDTVKILIKTILIIILLYPNWNIFIALPECIFNPCFLTERNKFKHIESNRTYQNYLDVLEGLQGPILFMSQGEPLSYTSCEVLYYYDQRFYEIFRENKDLKNIRYVVLFNRDSPITYAPLLKKVLYNPEKSKIIFDVNKWKIFKIESLQSGLKYNSLSTKISLSSKNPKNCIYKSTRIGNDNRDKYSSSKSEELLVLEPGLYDFICEMDVNVDRDTLISLKIEPYFGGAGNHILYLKKGYNHIPTRFLHSHKPFVLTFTTDNPKITFSNVKLLYSQKEKLFSPKNILFFDKNGVPLTIDTQGRAFIKSNNHELLFFDKPFNPGEILSFKANGFGIIQFAIVPNQYMKYVRKLMRSNWGRWIVEYLPISNHKYLIHGREVKINVPFKDQKSVIIYIKDDTNSEDQKIIFKDINIINKT